MRWIGRALLSATLAVVVVAALLAHEVTDAHASDPAGVYALIDDVAFEPADGPPTRVRLTGLFCVADGKHGAAYRTPRLGSLVYALSPDDGDQHSGERARIEDLRNASGTGKVVAFGSRWKAQTLRVTPTAAAPDRPPVFDEGIGVRVIETASYGAIGLLLSVPRIVSPSGDLPLRVHDHYGAMDHTQIVVTNPAGVPSDAHLLFEIERENGDLVASGPIALGADGRTAYSQWVQYRENESVTYRVRAVHADLPLVGVAVGHFTVKKAE